MHDIKEIKTTNSKASAKQEEDSKSSSGRTTPDRTREATATVEWAVLPHPPYRPDLSPSDFHSFGLSMIYRGRRLEDDDELKHSVRKELRRLSKEFYATAYGVSRKGGKTVLIMEETLWGNNLNFVKQVPMIYVSIIILAITVSEWGVTVYIHSFLNTVLVGSEWSASRPGPFYRS
jgi:hypothetical protein